MSGLRDSSTCGHAAATSASRHRDLVGLLESVAPRPGEPSLVAGLRIVRDNDRRRHPRPTAHSVIQAPVSGPMRSAYLRGTTVSGRCHDHSRGRARVIQRLPNLSTGKRTFAKGPAPL